LRRSYIGKRRRLDT